VEISNPFGLKTPPKEGVCVVPSSGTGLASIAIKIEGHAVRKRLLAPLWFVKGVFVQYCAKRSPMREYIKDFCGQSVLLPLEIAPTHLHAVFFVWAELMGVLSSSQHRGPLGVRVPLLRCLKGTSADISKTIEFLLHFFNSSYTCAYIKQATTQKKGDGFSVRKKGAKCLTMARLLPKETSDGQPQIEIFFPHAEAILDFEEGRFVSLNPDLIVALRGPQGHKKLMHYFLFEINKRDWLHNSEPLTPRTIPCVINQASFSQAARTHSETLSTSVPLYDHGVLTWSINAPPAPISQLRPKGVAGGGLVVCWFSSEQTQAAAELEATLEAHMRLTGAWEASGDFKIEQTGTTHPPLLEPPVTQTPPLTTTKNRSECVQFSLFDSERVVSPSKKSGSSDVWTGNSVHQNPVPQRPRVSVPSLFPEKTREFGASVSENPKKAKAQTLQPAPKKMSINHRAGALSKPPIAKPIWRLFEGPEPLESIMSEAEFLTHVLELYESLTPLQRRHFEIDRATMNEDQFRQYVMPILLKKRRILQQPQPNKL